MKNWYNHIVEERGDDIILGLLGNKIDLQNREVTTQEAFKYAESIKAIFQECSAKTNEHIPNFFRLILETLIKNVEDNGDYSL